MIAGFRRKNHLETWGRTLPPQLACEKKRLKGHLRDQRVSLEVPKKIHGESTSPWCLDSRQLRLARPELLDLLLAELNGWQERFAECHGVWKKLGHSDVMANMMGQEIWSILVYYGT